MRGGGGYIFFAIFFDEFCTKLVKNMFYLRLERKYKKSSVFSGKATKKHFAASLKNYKQALGGGGEMIKMHNINPWRMKNKSNLRISENKKSDW